MYSRKFLVIASLFQMKKGVILILSPVVFSIPAIFAWPIMHIKNSDCSDYSVRTMTKINCILTYYPFSPFLKSLINGKKGLYLRQIRFKKGISYVANSETFFPFMTRQKRFYR